MSSKLTLDDDNKSTNTDDLTVSTSMSSQLSIAGEENKAVYVSRALVFLTLVLTAITAGTLTYQFTSKVEEKEFKQEVSHYAVVDGVLPLGKVGVCQTLQTRLTHNTESNPL